MKRLLVLVVTALAVGVMPAAAQSKSSPVDAARRLSKDWKRATSGDLVAVGNTSEKTLREAVDEIVSFRAAFKHLYPSWRLDSPVPYRVVRFQSPLALQRYAPRDERGRPRQFVQRLLRKLSRSQRHRAWRRQHRRGVPPVHPLLRVEELPLIADVAERRAGGVPCHVRGRLEAGQEPDGAGPGEPSDRASPGAIHAASKDVVLATPADIGKFCGAPETGVAEMFYAESWALVHYLHIGRRQKRARAPSGGSSPRSSVAHQAEQALPRNRLASTIEQIDAELRRYITESDLSRHVVRSRSAPRWRAGRRADDRGRRQAHPGRHVEPGGRLRGRGEGPGGRVGAGPGASLRESGARGRPGRTGSAHTDAVGMLQGIVQAAPTNFAATYQLARALAVSGHHLEALDVFTRATKLLDASPDAWLPASACRRSRSDAARMRTPRCRGCSSAGRIPAGIALARLPLCASVSTRRRPRTLRASTWRRRGGTPTPCMRLSWPQSRIGV